MLSFLMKVPPEHTRSRAARGQKTTENTICSPGPLYGMFSILILTRLGTREH